MTEDVVGRALREAAATVTCFDAEELRMEIAAAAVAAFLRALPEPWGEDGALFWGQMGLGDSVPSFLAAAVERAASEDKT